MLATVEADLAADVAAHRAVILAARIRQEAVLALATLSAKAGVATDDDTLAQQRKIAEMKEKYVGAANAVGPGGCTPLIIACMQGGMANVTALLALGADPATEGDVASISAPEKKYKCTPLMLAARDGHVEIAKVFLAHERVDVNQASSDEGRTALWLSSGNAEVVTLLLSAEGIDANKATVHGATPLAMASYNGQATVVKLLLAQAGIDANQAIAAAGATPLSMACEKGHAAVVKLLLAHAGIDANLAVAHAGATALYLACEKGHVAVIKLLLAHGGIDANKGRADTGSTPLFTACQSDHAEIVTLMLAHNGIDVNKMRTDGMACTSLFFACFKGHVEIVTLLLAHDGIDANKPTADDGTTCLDIACHEGHAAIVELLLAHDGIDLNKETPGTASETPLYRACVNGHTGVVKLLLAHDGVDLNQATLKNGLTPFFVACQQGHVEIVTLMLAHGGIDANKATTDVNVTPLSMACLQGHSAVVELLLAHAGIAANTVTTDDGATPLHIASTNGHAAIVKLLLAHAGIDVNQARTDTGATPLFAACINGHVAIVRMLLAHVGIDVTKATTDSGETPLHGAITGNTLLIMQCLVVYGASLVAEDMEGLAPVEFAARENKLELADWLKVVSGYSPLRIAARCRMHTDAALLLRQGRIDPDDPTTTSVNDIMAVVAASHAKPCDQRDAGLCMYCGAAGATLRCSRCKGVQYCNVECQRGDWKHGGHKAFCKALKITRNNMLLRENAPQVCKATIKLVADATRGWHRTTHWLHHAQLRTAVFAVLVVVGRLEKKGSLQYKEDGEEDEDEEAEAEDAFPVLPIELWFHALRFVKRSWWAVKE